MDPLQVELLRTDELDIALRLSCMGTGGRAASETDQEKQDKEARRKEKKRLKEEKVLKAKEAKKNAGANAAPRKEKLVGNSAAATAEVDVNTAVDVASLVSSKNLTRRSEDADPERFYITTAINYTNGDPHIGHAYEAVTTDVQARYQRMTGKQVHFMTGSDEHGQKIANTAARQGLQPIEICDKYAGNFQALNKRLLISNNCYVRTTSDLHKQSAKRLWQICADKGDIYLGKYEGWYDEREEKYVTDSDAAMAEFKDSYGTPLKRMSEASYFFKMSKHIDWLIGYIEDNPSFIQPEVHRSLILKRLQDGHQNDLSISRTTFRHGVPVPNGFDQDHVMYVWFDALTSYLSGSHALIENDSLSVFWPASVHVIGKDITWFHCVIWPCMLRSAGMLLPETVFAHGFVAAADGRKMSKSLGNVVDPHGICDQYPVDTFRWYICRDAIYGSDLSFSKKGLVLAHNAELCNTFGNLVHRSLSLMDRYNKGEVPRRQEGFDFIPFDFDYTRKAVDAAMSSFALQDACAAAMEALRETNKFLQEEEPWMKKDEKDHPRRLECVRVCLEAVYAVSHFLVAFLPTACTRVFEKLGIPPVPIGTLNADFTNISEGTKLSVGSILFNMLDLPEEVVAPAATPKGGGNQLRPPKSSPSANGSAAGKMAEGTAPRSGTVDSFSNMDIRVGRITKVWEHENAERLYCEEIDVGEDQPRAIASGLREHHTLQEMQGRLVLVVCNLKPAKLAGFVSNGMVLAAKSVEGKVELVRAPEGSRVGERARVEGSEGEPLPATKVKKQKAFEELAKDLRTREESPHVATYKGKPITTSVGPCVADSVAGGTIS